MDLLEVFLSRCIQPLQAHDHPKWMYSRIDDTARVHPEEVPAKTVALWLKSITDNKDNPRGARRVDPFRDNNQPDKLCLPSPTVSGYIFRLPLNPTDFYSTSCLVGFY